MPRNDAELIDEVGQALWGPTWKGPMAEAVRHQKAAIADWASGRLPVPAGVWSELALLMRRRQHELDRLSSRVQRAHDIALQRTIDLTKRGKRP
ncbi:MAG TPA: hypothetical protein VE527_19180 [Reyranella sp.]|jgi:hypothetical protein|nr:hypothetical protein [Reyranella sp.]